MTKITTLVCCMALLLAGSAFGQAITFTGDVSADFAMDQITADPGGIDVGLPANLVSAVPGVISGWDIQALAFSYDGATDTLYCGIDTFGIAGDADGDGDPGVTHPAIAANGGSDNPNWEGSESFTFGLDLNDDGVLDVVAGIPAGADFSGYTVALYDQTLLFPGQNILSDPYLRFGAALPMHTGPAPVMPSAAGGDIEFTITNFSTLLTGFSTPGQTQIGLHAFLGSLEDDGIGEDYLPALEVFSDDVPPCFPIADNWVVRDPEILMGGNIKWETEFGLRDGYGCCLLFSLFQNPVPFPITSVPGAPIVEIGMFGVPNSIGSIDRGVPPSTGNMVNCKLGDIIIPPTFLPSGTVVYTQIFEYFTNYSQTFYTSNMQVLMVP